MSREELVRLMQNITMAYPAFEVTRDKVDLWHDLMKDMPYEAVNARLKQHILSSEYAPKIAEISVKPKQRNAYLEQLKQWEREGAHRNG